MAGKKSNSFKPRATTTIADEVMVDEFTPDVVESEEEVSVEPNAEPLIEVTDEVSESEPPDVVLSITEEEKPAPEKLVRIRPKSTFTSYIGGTAYHFEKDKCMNVPENVRRILSRRDLLKPL